MAKMKLALQRVSDQSAFEVEVEGVTPEAYVKDLNDGRKEGESEVVLISAWQTGESEEEAPVVEEKKKSFFGSKVED